jgi:hypothetical protein
VPLAVLAAAQQLTGEPVEIGHRGMPARGEQDTMVEVAIPRSAASRTGQPGHLSGGRSS